MFSNLLPTRHFLKIAWRNVARQRIYSLINILGISIGLTISILILFFVVHEMKFDKFHVQGNRIYKVDMAVKHGDQVFNIDGIHADWTAKVLKSNAAVTDYVRLKDIGTVNLKNSKDPAIKFKEKSFVFADKSLFTVFTYPLLQGDIKTALQTPFSLIISEQAAEKYFPKHKQDKGNLIGKTLDFNGKHLFTITGLMKDIPSNSSMKFDFVAPLETYPKLGAEEKNIWETSGAFRTFFLVHAEGDAQAVEQSMANINTEKDITYTLKQYSSQHLSGGFSENINTRFVYIFLGISLLILFLALFNYMSLTTARATTRAKEVGIRKVAGVSTLGLLKQFYWESVFVCTIAFGLAMLLIKLLLNPFYNFLGIHIDSTFLQSPIILLVVAGLFLICTLLAGSYPAMVLSKFKPIDVLKGKYANYQGGSLIRKGITIFQFTVSIVLIVCVITTQKQLKYLKSIDLGFSQAQVLAIPTEGSMQKNFLSFKNEIKKLSGVQSITSATSPFYKGYNAWFTKSTISNKDVFLYSMNADENFIHTVGLEWAHAPLDHTMMENKVYINEEAAAQLEIGGDFKGKTVELGDKKLEIGGILKDFHFNALREEIKPLTLGVYSENRIDFENKKLNPTVYVRFYEKSDITKQLKTIKTIYEQYESESPFEYYFLDDAFNETYIQQTRLSTIFTIFSSVALFIACMGLFGLATFMAVVRTKEIGIRKVLGAGIFQVTTLLSKDFLIMVFIAILIATPIAYYVMNKWLLDFAYRIQLPWWIFVIAGGLAMCIAILTVSSQAIKVAVSNPTNSLRTE